MTEDARLEAAWPSLPRPQRDRLHALLAALRRDPEILGIAAGGSFAARGVDDFSDLDLVVVVDPAAWPAILDRRPQLAAAAGELLAAFTGEHVGEPRLLICLYGPPLVHVDLKFVTPDQLRERVEDPVLLWDRSDVVRQALAAGRATYPRPDLQWIEDRFWVWVHYAATKLGRGELFEVIDYCNAVRRLVLGPLVLEEVGARPDGVRRLERLAPGRIEALRGTVATHDVAGAVEAVRATIALYRELRARARSLHRREAAEAAAVEYFERVAASRGVGESE